MYLVWTSLLCYGIACLLPAYKSTEENKQATFAGLSCLLFGWFSFNVPMFLAWLANIAYAISITLVFFSHRHTFAFTLSIAAFILAFFALKVNFLPKNEGGDMLEVRISYGFYVWIMSFSILVFHLLFINFYQIQPL